MCTAPTRRAWRASQRAFGSTARLRSRTSRLLLERSEPSARAAAAGRRSPSARAPARMRAFTSGRAQAFSRRASPWHDFPGAVHRDDSDGPAVSLEREHLGDDERLTVSGRKPSRRVDHRRAAHRPLLNRRGPRPTVGIMIASSMSWKKGLAIGGLVVLLLAGMRSHTSNIASTTVQVEARHGPGGRFGSRQHPPSTAGRRRPPLRPRRRRTPRRQRSAGASSAATRHDR